MLQQKKGERTGEHPAFLQYERKGQLLAKGLYDSVSQPRKKGSVLKQCVLPTNRDVAHAFVAQKRFLLLLHHYLLEELSDWLIDSSIYYVSELQYSRIISW